jgi:hypothetical protein
MDEDKEERAAFVSKLVKRTILVGLALVSIWSVVVSPNHLGVFAFLLVAWVIGFTLAPHWARLSDWFNSDKGVMDYIHDRRAEKGLAPIADVEQSKKNSLDSDKLHNPLSDYEERAWLRITNSLQDDM